MYKVKNFADGVLSSHTANTITTFPTTDLPVPGLVILSAGRDLSSLRSGEIIEILSKSGEEYSTSTISGTWPQGTLVLANLFAENIEEIQNAIEVIYKALVFAVGGSTGANSGIFQTNYLGSDLEFTIVGGNFSVAPGLAMVSGTPVYVESKTIPISTATFYLHSDGNINTSSSSVPLYDYDGSNLTDLRVFF